MVACAVNKVGNNAFAVAGIFDIAEILSPQDFNSLSTEIAEFLPRDAFHAWRGNGFDYFPSVAVPKHDGFIITPVVRWISLSL